MVKKELDQLVQVEVKNLKSLRRESLKKSYSIVESSLDRDDAEF